MTALIVHGHFYQPPRENPWTGEVDPEPGAATFHDWNERIHAECYAPNIVNYPLISFNFGPTLLSWLESHHRDTYQKILIADRESVAARGGHGNAIAQAYGHAILPLCNERDRLTQVVWGLADFRFRFGREAEALWLPETAANDEVLALLIEQGMRYVILAPNQGKGVVDTSKPYLFRHPDGSGRSIAVFFYHGPLARAIAFERALASSRGLVEKFVGAAAGGDLVNVATDGETYGHHFKFGDLCLTHALTVEAKSAGFGSRTTRSISISIRRIRSLSSITDRMVKVVRGVACMEWRAGRAIVVVTLVVKKAGTSRGASHCAKH